MTVPRQAAPRGTAPHRRRAAVTVAMVAALAGLASGCDGIEIEVPAGSLPVPVSIAPAPSASVGRPEYVCTAVYKVLTDGIVRLAGGGAEEMRRVLADMATQVTAAGATAIDPAQRKAADSIAATLSEGAGQPDPKAFVDGEFATIGQRLDGTCT
ncbi:hypothetical protein QLQ12_40650 [Actinoplanes sp. NEAU-A12]|uniref:Lipoprotein n=1 Tax=Actinoplanes sandaracinus TaxID=3045177 RepID=A0ABT6WZ88_9ACTN|nr:hypothetical protein [Actinoplanes sandaracinus]MDI6104915.1 hypothetical protein [Actinoplanes sandaracinus]